MNESSRESWISAIFDEIALEGLEGVTLPSLWELLSNRLKCGTTLPKNLQNQIWTLLLRSPDKLEFYELPKSRPKHPPYNRFDDFDPENGTARITESCPFHNYEYAPVSEGKIMGTCVDFKTRKVIEMNKLCALTAEEATVHYGQSLVVVASQEQRLMALISPNVKQPAVGELTPIQYVVLETIGRSRYNGETTVGPWSLLRYCKDASVMSYIKHKLVKLQFVASQPYTEQGANRLSVCNLLLLPRFFCIYKNHMQTTIEKLYLELKNRDDHQMPTTDIIDFIIGNCKSKAKRLLVSHTFRKVFVTKQVLATPRKITVLQLRNPNMTIDELFSVEPETKEENPAVLGNLKHTYVDMPIDQECFQAIERFGSRGISAAELATYLSINGLNLRGIIKCLKEEGLIKHYQVHEKKNRIKRYVAINLEIPSELENQQAQEEQPPLQCNEQLNIPINSDIIMADLPEIVANIRLMNLGPKGAFLATQRVMGRKELIVRKIDERCMVHMMELRQTIQRNEKEKGYREVICRKSLCRLLHTLQEMRVVNVYEITLNYQQQLRVYRLITHPKIDLEHKLLQNEVIRLKNNFHFLNQERIGRPPKAQKVKKDPKETMPKKKISQPKTHAPKLLLARALHEFLFYLQSELHVDQKSLDVTIELLQHWQSTEPALQPKEFLAEWKTEEVQMFPYCDQISWRTFIPPLPRYEDKPAGWLHFVNAVERMPLSVFVKIFRLERAAADQLQTFLQHPVRQHYLVGSISAKVKRMVSREQLHSVYISTLRLLNNMGLVQIALRSNVRDPLQLFVFINRKTMILDTTISDANYKKVNDSLSYESYNFEFKNREEVDEYWAKLQHVCIYTKLGFRKSTVSTLSMGEPKRMKQLNFLPPVDYQEAQDRDDGTVPGDRKGAAGLCSSIFAHLFRHWSWVQSKKAAPRRNVLNKRPALPLRKMSKQVNKLRPKKRSTKSSSSTGATSSTKRRTGPRDDIDRDALKNMRTLRVKWTEAEDRVLKIGRAVYQFIDAPIIDMGLLNICTVCRDIIRHRLGIMNKTAQACARRMQFIRRMKRDIQEVPYWVYCMQTKPEFTHIYNEHFLSTLKRAFPIRNEYSDALLIHSALLMAQLDRMISDDRNTNQLQFILPDTLDDYKRQFRECVRMNEDQQLHYANPTTDIELQVVIAQCVLHSTLCCARDKTLYNLQAFEIYKHFSEEVLNAAFKKSRTEALVIMVKRRNIEIVNQPSYTLSAKYKNRLIYMKLGYNVFDAYYEFVQTALDRYSFGGAGGQATELYSPNIAHLLFESELLTKNYLNVKIQLPTSILTVDASEPHFSVSSSDRIIDHFQNILDNAPQTEYAKRMESECSSRQSIRVRFHPASLNYKLQYNPYDQLSKLPMRAMHFFCAVDQLGEWVNINYAKLHHRETIDGKQFDLADCPFSCIMKSGNYLNAVERISHEQRTTLKQLVGDTLSQAEVNLCRTSNNAILLEPSNLLPLIQQLELHWRQLEQPCEKKDVGKVASEQTLHTLIDWRTLCASLLDYEPNASEADHACEYEPSLNKEDKERARAQDVFVVQLPKLSFELKEELRNDGMVERKQVPVPRVLLEAELQREALLDKVIRESYWHYTDHSMESLLPLLNERQLDETAIRRIEELLHYIENYRLGIEGTELRRKFQWGDFLIEALHILSDHNLIKRVGIASCMYVHKQYIRNWVVHTFHVKRLERERVQSIVSSTPCSLSDVTDIKQKHSTDEAPSTSQKENVNSGPESSSEPEAKRRRRSATTETVKLVKPQVVRDVIVIRPQPWIRVNASLNRRVLDRWMSTLLQECVSRAGCTVQSVFFRFPHLLPVDIMFLLELLGDLNCIHLMEMEPQELHLGAGEGEDYTKEERVTELYDPELTYIRVHCDAMFRMASFIGTKKYSTEFI